MYVTTNAGPVAIYTGTSGQTVLLGSVTVPAIPFATTVVITATGVVAMNATGEQWPCCADVTTSPRSNITPSAANQILINSSSSQPQAASAFALERTFSLAANTAQTYYLYGFTGTDGTPQFQTATVSSVNLKAEVIKR